MDKYYEILEAYNGCLTDLLEDYDISNEDVLAALDAAGVLDLDEMYARMYHGVEEELDS